jgi:hypothetical protein
MLQMLLSNILKELAERHTGFDHLFKAKEHWEKDCQLREEPKDA